MRFLPLGVDVSGARVVVVGGGPVGARKVRTLLRAGADVTVVAPSVTAELAHEIEQGRVRWHRELVRRDHLEGSCLVVMATNHAELNALGARTARASGVLACDASSSREPGVIFGALLEDDGVTIATFTDGRDPSLARRTRDRIARLLSEDDKRAPAQEPKADAS
jgi:uroporphyrin-III C-methyltransferase/precorrin-2 dehydrogenase/sirohydrochlorin ferrochelatase